MGDEPEEIRTLKQKALFYTTAFFVLLGTFSLFAFLFLVPFVIDPAFTTIFMQFDETPVMCVTIQTEYFKGASNCSWTSCREGCTKEVYECTQITVNYKLYDSAESADENRTKIVDVTNSDNRFNDINLSDGGKIKIDSRSSDSSSSSNSGSKQFTNDNTNNNNKMIKNKLNVPNSSSSSSSSSGSNKNININVNDVNKYNEPVDEFIDGKNSAGEYEQGLHRFERGIREYDYGESLTPLLQSAIIDKTAQSGLEFMEYGDLPEMSSLLDNDNNSSEWFFIGAKLFPNVKGCGYPPMLNCTIWAKQYKSIGANFSCYYSRIDPSLVISDLDMWQNTLNLVYAMAIPIPSFIISVIYLIFAYFKIYNEDEETAPLDKNAEDIDADDGVDEDDVQQPADTNSCIDVIIANGSVGGGGGGGGGSGVVDGMGTPNAISPTLPTSGQLTPNSDLASFGHQLKVKMVDEMSRESLDAGFLSNSASLQGNLSKTMTTSISTQPGPIASV